MAAENPGFTRRSSKSWTAGALILGILMLPAIESEACSILTLKDHETVLMGNNEDWLEPGVIWFVPGRKGRFGRVNVGFKDDFAQGSMNEKGLSFDAAALSEVPWSKDPSKESPKNLIEKIMNECATVEEAIAYFEKYNCHYLSSSQFLFADATGDSAIIGWLPESGLSVQRIDGPHQVVTNTRLEAADYRCQRYVQAERVLDSKKKVSLETVAAALEAVHQRGPAFTSYSTVYDLKAKKVFVFNLANFDEMVSFDLNEELSKRPKTYKLSKLFKNSPDLATIKKSPQRDDFGTRVPLSQDILEKYAGLYSPDIDPKVRVKILRDGQGLRVENPGQPSAHLFPESEISFRIAPDRGQVTFHLAPDGTVEGLTLHKQKDVYAKRVGEIARAGASFVP